MKVIIAGLESRVGQSARTGNDYAMYTMRMLVPVSPGQTVKHNANNVHRKEGYVLVEQDINEVIHDKARGMASSGGYPFTADVVMEQNVGRNNDLITECLDIKPIPAGSLPDIPTTTPSAVGSMLSGKKTG